MYLISRNTVHENPGRNLKLDQLVHIFSDNVEFIAKCLNWNLFFYVLQTFPVVSMENLVTLFACMQTY